MSLLTYLIGKSAHLLREFAHIFANYGDNMQ